MPLATPVQILLKFRHSLTKTFFSTDTVFTRLWSWSQLQPGLAGVARAWPGMAGSPGAARHAAGSPGSLGSPAARAGPSPGFKNTQTLSELVQLLIRRDADAKERAHAALALQYLSLNVDKVRRAR